MVVIYENVSCVTGLRRLEIDGGGTLFHAANISQVSHRSILNKIEVIIQGLIKAYRSKLGGQI